MVHQNGPTTNPIRVPRTRIVLVELGIDSTLFFPERQKIIDLFSKSFDHDTENREIDEKKSENEHLMLIGQLKSIVQRNAMPMSKRQIIIWYKNVSIQIGEILRA